MWAMLATMIRRQLFQLQWLQLQLLELWRITTTTRLRPRHHIHPHHRHIIQHPHRIPQRPHHTPPHHHRILQPTRRLLIGRHTSAAQRNRAKNAVAFVDANIVVILATLSRREQPMRMSRSHSKEEQANAPIGYAISARSITRRNRQKSTHCPKSVQTIVHAAYAIHGIRLQVVAWNPESSAIENAPVDAMCHHK